MRAVKGHVIVVLLGALALFEALSQSYDAPRWAGVVCACALVAPLLWRRRHPVRAAVACLAVYLVMLGAGAFAHESGAAPALTFVVVGYAAGRYATRGADAAWTVLGVLAVALVAGLAWRTGITFTGFLFAIGFVGGAALLGRLVRREVRSGVRLRDELRRLIAEMEAGPAAAVDAERAAIAADLHDLAGHGLTLVTVHADAARTVLRTAPERVPAQLGALRDAAAETARELGALAARMRARDDTAVADGPAPSLASLGGAGVSVAVGAGWDALPRSVAAVGARVAQEGVTNARKHAAGAAVRLSAVVDDGCAVVEVVDDGGASAGLASGGVGLSAMRERVELLGGVVEAGPFGGGWRVRARIPAGAEAPVVDERHASRGSRGSAWQALSLWAPAVVLGAWGVVETLVLEDAGDPGVRAGAYVVGAVALLWRRRFPLVVAGVVGAAVIVRFLPATLSPSSSVVTPLAAVAAYSAVAHARRVVAGVAAAAGLVVALIVALVVEPGDVLAADLFFLPLLVAGAAGAGFQVRLHRARARGLRRATDSAAAEAAAASAEAARRERARLVGELTTITTDLLGEAEQLIARAEAALPDRERCSALLARVSASSRASLDELRRLVAVLRSA
jgi:signal transduction histidine kinase